jgi:hypothetical protein
MLIQVAVSTRTKSATSAGISHEQGEQSKDMLIIYLCLISVRLCDLYTLSLLTSSFSSATYENALLINCKEKVETSRCGRRLTEMNMGAVMAK